MPRKQKITGELETDVYTLEGEKKEKLVLPEEVFGLEWNDDLVSQVVVSMRSNLRKNIAHAKTRAEVRGGGKKPWRQKGTGQARHGSIRSPIWIGGGVTHGPLTEKNYFKKINRKMKRKALYSVLSRKVKEGEIMILEDIFVNEPKTKEAAKIMANLCKIGGFEKLAGTKKNRAMVLVKEKNDNLKRSFRNLPGVLLDEAKNLNVLEALTYKYLIIPKQALKAFK